MGRALVTCESIAEIGAAAVLGSIARRPGAPGAVAETATSSTVPQAPQSGHLPTHLATSCEQAEHRKIALVFATPARYAAGPTERERLPHRVRQPFGLDRGGGGAPQWPPPWPSGAGPDSGDSCRSASVPASTGTWTCTVPFSLKLNETV
ncbi:Uncharacterised protein [Mycobacteroides abscessus subsp. abscessus]|nr:Uncharacterised protein [Mycobacteroides abscessus subsp. abscessus]